MHANEKSSILYKGHHKNQLLYWLTVSTTAQFKIVGTKSFINYRLCQQCKFVQLRIYYICTSNKL